MIHVFLEFPATVRRHSQERKPYSFGGRFFMRDGASSQQMYRLTDKGQALRDRLMQTQ